MARPRLLLIRLGGIGDNLIASSPLSLLAREYEVDVMAQDPQHVLFENNPYVSRVIVKQHGDIPGGDEWARWFVKRGEEYDRWINLSHSLETKLALFPNEAAFWWPEEFRRRLCGRSYLEYVHDICGVPDDYTVGPRFYPTEEEVDKALRTLDMIRAKSARNSVLGVPISGSRIDKIWPYLPILCAQIIRETGTAVLLFGNSQRDTVIAEHVQAFVKLWCGSLTGLHAAISTDKDQPQWPIRRAIATLQQCDAVLTPDTGLAWGVAMEVTPKVVLLSHASPENITKHWVRTTTLHADAERVSCWPCHRLHADASTCRKAEQYEAAACMTDISHTAVFAAVIDAIKKGTGDGWHHPIRDEGSAGLEPAGSDPDTGSRCLGVTGDWRPDDVQLLRDPDGDWR